MWGVLLVIAAIAHGVAVPNKTVFPSRLNFLAGDLVQRAMSESDTQRAILDYLTLRKHFCWRNNSGAFKTVNGAGFLGGWLV